MHSQVGSTTALIPTIFLRPTTIEPALFFDHIQGTIHHNLPLPLPLCLCVVFVLHVFLCYLERSVCRCIEVAGRAKRSDNEIEVSTEKRETNEVEARNGNQENQNNQTTEFLTLKMTRTHEEEWQQ